MGMAKKVVILVLQSESQPQQSGDVGSVLGDSGGVSRLEGRQAGPRLGILSLMLIGNTH